MSEAELRAELERLQRIAVAYERDRIWRASSMARARGLAQAIAECRDDARMDGIREGAAEIAELLEDSDG